MKDLGGKYFRLLERLKFQNESTLRSPGCTGGEKNKSQILKALVGNGNEGGSRMNWQQHRKNYPSAMRSSNGQTTLKSFIFKPRYVV